MQLSFYHFILAFAAGLFGTLAMDAIKYVGHKMHLIGGVKMEMLGRWSIGMVQGRLIYKDIHESPEAKNEVLIGWLFHYFTGGLVALFFPFILAISGQPSLDNLLIYGVLFGLSTSILPWFIVYPAFGKGWFGSKAPSASKPVLTSLVSHTFYGAGIGFIFLMGS